MFYLFPSFLDLSEMGFEVRVENQRLVQGGELLPCATHEAAMSFTNSLIHLIHTYIQV